MTTDVSKILDSLNVAEIDQEIAAEQEKINVIQKRIDALKVLARAANARDNGSAKRKPRKAKEVAESNGNGHAAPPPFQTPKVTVPITRGRPSNLSRIQTYVEANGACRAEHLARALSLPLDSVRLIVNEHFTKLPDGKYQAKG